jgi:hypothetical protein
MCSGEGRDQGRFSMVDMTCGSDDSHCMFQPLSWAAYSFVAGACNDSMRKGIYFRVFFVALP